MSITEAVPKIWKYLTEDKKEEKTSKDRVSELQKQVSGGGSVSVRDQIPRELLSDEDFYRILGYPSSSGIIGGRESGGLASMREGMNDLDTLYGELKRRIEDSKDLKDYSPLMAVSDELTGSKLLDKYNRPKSRQEKLEGLLGIQSALQKSRGELTAAEINFLKSQFYPTMGVSTSVKGGGSGGGGARLPASQVEKIADMKEQRSGVDAFYALWKGYNEPSEDTWDVVSSWFKSKAPLTDANTYMSLLRQRATTLGKAIEGRMTDADYRRYEKEFLPLPWDPEWKAQEKLEALKTYINNKIAERERNFSIYGYDVPGEGRSTPKTFEGRKKEVPKKSKSGVKITPKMMEEQKKLEEEKKQIMIRQGLT